MFPSGNFSDSLGTCRKRESHVAHAHEQDTNQCTSSNNSLTCKLPVVRERVNSSNIGALLCAQPELAYTTK